MSWGCLRLTTASDSVRANESCWDGQRRSCRREGGPAIGFPYSGNLFTSATALAAASTETMLMKAWPRMRTERCATTSSTAPYCLKSVRRDCFITARGQELHGAE